MSTEQFNLSTIATEIREYSSKYGKFHDDFTCLAEFTSDNSSKISVTNIEFANMGDIGPLTKLFYSRLFENRKRLLEIHTSEAESRYTTLKKFVADLLKECPELAAEDTGMGSLFASFVGTMDVLRSSVNAYYKLKAEAQGGKDYIDRLSDIILISLRHLMNGETIPDEIINDSEVPMKDEIAKLSSLFNKVNPTRRQELIDLFSNMMKSILSCFVLYRFPVVVVHSQKPIYLSRFVPLIKLKPFLDLFNIILGSLTLAP
jgi:hypothetical protein